MSNARIIEIPATRQIRSGKNNTMRKMRVAAYCRVSTEEEEQQGSFETQKLYYTEKINSTSEWELAGIYADDGISGIHTKKRDGFNQMIQDCKKKKIDLILTKSISRFARNTLDSIQYVRMLKAIGIAVIFEKENINTSTMNSEMILTVLSAFAQAESESISQNVARGKRMGFRQGKFPFPYGQILGYRKGLDGKPEVIPEEAEVIRMIFNSYLQGASLLTIKKKLEAGGVLTARGNKKWSSESVQRILQNEKYCGDVLLQKTFIEDVLTGVSKKNTGQLPQYYIENNHEGIVTKHMLPLYYDEVCSADSRKMIEEHLQECEKCSNIFQKLKTECVVDTKENAESIQSSVMGKMAHSWKRSLLRSFIIGIVITTIVLTAIFGTYYALFIRQNSMVSPEQISISAYSLTDEQITFRLELLDGYCGGTIKTYTDENRNLYISVLRTVIKEELSDGETEIMNYGFNHEKKDYIAVYYGTPNNCELIWKKGDLLPTAPKDIFE